MFKLEDISIFSVLKPQHLKELYNKTFIKHFTKDSIVFYEGDDSKYLYVLLDGDVKLYKTTSKNTQIQINRLSAPAIIGEYACFEQHPFPATCEFITKGTMRLIPFEIIFKHLNNSEFSLKIIKSLTGKISILSTLIHKETVFSSEAKVADFIINNLPLFYKLKHNEIASMLNLAPETFSRIVTKFKKEKIISIKDNKIDIYNKNALYDIIDTNKIRGCSNCIAHLKV